MNTAGRVDIHCHLLPMWDDGPRSMEDVLLMAQRAVENGVSGIFVTPHVGRDLSAMGLEVPAEAHRIPEAVQAVQEAIYKSGLELKLWPGAEVVIAPDLPERLDRDAHLTLGGWNRHILLELPPGVPWTRGVDDVLFKISLRGVTPIVAHPERYPDVQRDLANVRRAAARGVQFQLTAASIKGRGAERDTSERLLKEGLISFIASDAHSPHDVWPQQMEHILNALIGSEHCQSLYRNANALLPDSGISAKVPGNLELRSDKAETQSGRGLETQRKGLAGLWARLTSR